MIVSYKMRAKLVKKTTEAKGTKSFFFVPEKPLKFLPGQYVYLTLGKLLFPDVRGATRHFTISSSPTEKDHMRITTRVRDESGFKQTLDSLKIGETVEIEGPNGTLILDENEADKNHIFLAGGIGITPFISFVEYSLNKKLKIQAHLIYSNSEADQITFKKEIDKAAKSLKSFKVTYIVSSRDGRLDDRKLKDLTLGEADSETIWWVIGPPAYIDAMEMILEKMGIPSGKIRSEKFTGY